MADAFARAAAALVADANMGTDAVYLPARGARFACRLVLSRPMDLMAPGGISTRFMASLPVSAVAVPVRGDQIRINALPPPGNMFKVEEVTTDPMRAMHDLTLSSAA